MPGDILGWFDSVPNGKGTLGYSDVKDGQEYPTCMGTGVNMPAGGTLTLTLELTRIYSVQALFSMYTCIST